MHPAARKLRKTLAGERPAVGTFLLEFRGPNVVHVVADSGLDFVLIDCEHGQYSSREVESLLDAAWSREFPALVRVAGSGREMITRALDAGAAGILVPAISSVHQVHDVVRASKYRPIGRRGVHLMRPHTRHRPPADVSRYLAEANRDVLTLIQIELVPALEQVDEIAAIDGVDGLYVGPGDLSVDLDRPGDWNCNDLWQAIAATGAACRRHQKFFGCHYDSPELLPQLYQHGVQMLGNSCDLGIFRTACVHVAEQAAAALRAGTPGCSEPLSSEVRSPIAADSSSRVPFTSRTGGCHAVDSTRIYAD